MFGLIGFEIVLKKNCVKEKVLVVWIGVFVVVLRMGFEFIYFVVLVFEISVFINFVILVRVLLFVFCV